MGILVQFIFTTAMVTLRIVMIAFDLVTTPIYALFQHPWRKVYENVRIRAQLEDPSDPYSAYVRIRPSHEQCKNYSVFQAETIAQLQQITFQLFPPNQRCLGYRPVLNVLQQSQYNKQTSNNDNNNKMLIKYDLSSEYRWFSNQEVDTMIGRLVRTFIKSGVKFQEPVVIFSETRIG